MPDEAAAAAAAAAAAQVGGLVPRPDPTVLTTAALMREVESVRREFVLEIKSIETRINGMDHASMLLQAAHDRIPSEVDTKVSHLQALHEEKFRSVEQQFRERDVRSDQTSRDSKTAVDAALQAAKEAVGQQTEASDRSIAKSEAATTKQIDQLGVLIQSNGKGIDDKIADIKDRLTLIEGKAVGGSTTTATHQQGNSFLLALFVAGISLVGLVALLIRDFAR